MNYTARIFFYDYLTVSSLIDEFVTSVLPEKTVVKTALRQCRSVRKILNSSSDAQFAILLLVSF